MKNIEIFLKFNYFKNAIFIKLLYSKLNTLIKWKKVKNF